MRGAFISALAVAAAIAFLTPALAVSKSVYGSNGCGTSLHEPSEMVFACADAKLKVRNVQWTHWDDGKAVGGGVLTHPDFNHPRCANRSILACPWVESEAKITLWRPAYCRSNGRWQFTRLRLAAPQDVDPEVRLIKRDYRCNEYSKPRKTISRLCGPLLPEEIGAYSYIRTWGIRCAPAQRIAFRARKRFCKRHANCLVDPSVSIHQIHKGRISYRGWSCRVRVGYELSETRCRKRGMKFNQRSAA